MRTLGLPRGGANLWRFGRIPLLASAELPLRKIIGGGKVNPARIPVFLFLLVVSWRISFRDGDPPPISNVCEHDVALYVT